MVRPTVSATPDGGELLVGVGDDGVPVLFRLRQPRPSMNPDDREALRLIRSWRGEDPTARERQARVAWQRARRQLRTMGALPPRRDLAYVAETPRLANSGRTPRTPRRPRRSHRGSRAAAERGGGHEGPGEPPEGPEAPTDRAAEAWSLVAALIVADLVGGGR